MEEANKLRANSRNAGITEARLAGLQASVSPNLRAVSAEIPAKERHRKGILDSVDSEHSNILSGSDAVTATKDVKISHVLKRQVELGLSTLFSCFLFVLAFMGDPF